MYVAVETLTRENILLAEEFFWQQFCSTLFYKENYAGSLVGRYIVAQYFMKYRWQKLDVFADDYRTHWYYFSLSHVKDIVTVAISAQKIWIDVAKVEPRHASLLQRYRQELTILQTDPWRWFYEQRVAKEALIKYLSLPFSYVDTVRVVKKVQVDTHDFYKYITVVYENREYEVAIWKYDDDVYKKEFIYGII